MDIESGNLAQTHCLRNCAHTTLRIYVVAHGILDIWPLSRFLLGLSQTVPLKIPVAHVHHKPRPQLYISGCVCAFAHFKPQL